MENANLNIYDTLLRLPLFQGLSQSALAQVVGHTKFDFLRHGQGQEVLSAYAPCDSMIFLIKGELSAITYSDDRSYHVEEYECAPFVIEPERLFGLSQHYGRSYVATTDVDLLRISKSEAIRLAAHFYVFRINLLNILTTQNQRLQHQVWRIHPPTCRDKIIRFLADHCLRPAGRKTFHIGMQQLATHIGESRLNVSRMLHSLADERLLAIGRGTIEVPALEQLLHAQASR